MERRIVCFGDSNTWGYDAEDLSRFPKGVRWTGRLASLLGDEFDLVEEGLSGRTSVVDDPLFEGLNAYKYIQPCLMSHSPLEMVIIMLGTNDTKERFSMTSHNIAQGISRLVQKIRTIPCGVDNKSPKIIVIAPPPIEEGYLETEVVNSMGLGCDTKAFELEDHLKEFLKLEGIELIETKGIIGMNKIDYMHLDSNGHKDMADLVFSKIKKYLEI